MADDYSPQVLESRAAKYDECYQLYDDDRLEECIDTIESHLTDSSVPIYHRMKFEIVLAACLGDWYEADDAIVRCEDLWQSTNAAYQQRDADDDDADDDELVQEGLQDIRELLDGLRFHHDALPHRIECRGGDVETTE